MRVECGASLHGPLQFDGAEICAPCVYETTAERLHRMEHSCGHGILERLWTVSCCRRANPARTIVFSLGQRQSWGTCGPRMLETYGALGK